MTSRVQIYKNLHRTRKQGRTIYSVRDAKTRKVIRHVDHILLEDVKFRVSPSGRDRVRKEKRKNVHAYIEGVPVEGAVLGLGERVTYDPYKQETFEAFGTAIQAAPYCLINQGGVYV